MGTFDGPPDTRYRMRAAGYKFKSMSTCKSCGAPIEWWLTTKGRNLPFDRICSETETTHVHFETCPNADQHRTRKPAAESAPAKPAAVNLGTLEDEAARLLARAKGRVVTILTDGGAVSIWRKDMRAEDIAHELITEANRLRRELQRKDLRA